MRRAKLKSAQCCNYDSGGGYNVKINLILCSGDVGFTDVKKTK
jgi:hypothetical protein